MRVQKQIRVGEPVVVEAVPEDNRFGVVFEDDGDTGYLYGLDVARHEEPIIDALHVYDVSDADRGRQAAVVIEWNPDLTGAVLYVDAAAQAVFDFANSRACCRSGFPPAGTRFAGSHDWDDSVVRRVNPSGV